MHLLFCFLKRFASKIQKAIAHRKCIRTGGWLDEFKEVLTLLTLLTCFALYSIDFDFSLDLILSGE